MRPRPSLKVRGIQLLAQREHSRVELQRKLLKHARADQQLATAAAVTAAAAAVAAAVAATTASGVCAAEAGREADPVPHDGPSPEQVVESVLDWLQAQGYLSEARFVESRVHARAQRYGNLRIRQELAQHGVALPPADSQVLKESELSRAREVWRRKFGEAPADLAARAKQMRFLSARGFSPEVIRRVVRGEDD